MPYAYVGRLRRGGDLVVVYPRERDTRTAQELNAAANADLAATLRENHRRRVASRGQLDCWGRHPFVAPHTRLFAWGRVVLFGPALPAQAVGVKQTPQLAGTWVAAATGFWWIVAAAEVVVQLHKALSPTGWFS